MKKKKTVSIIAVIVLVMVLSGITVFAFGDTGNFDPDKKYRCKGVCTIQRIFDINGD